MNYLVRKICVGMSLTMGLVGVANATYVEGNPLSYTDPLGLVKVNLLPPGTPAWKQAEGIPDDPNSTTVFAHGDYNGNVLGPDGKIMSPQSIADRIINGGGKNGMPIGVRACGAGSGTNSAAQNLSKLFPNSLVTGPISSITPDGTTWWPAYPWGFYPIGNSGLVPFLAGKAR